MQRYKDFDAMFAEMKDDTINVKILGEFYKVPRSIPAAFMLELSRKAEDDSVSDKTLFQLADMVFGRDVVDKWARTPGFTTNKLIEIVKWVLSVQTGGGEGEMTEMTEDDMGETDAKN